ncbi:hypothetical protein MKX03_031398 [Papaver bracteatum]|nr:hypothetical protein MKX03_031398 [Papaver bracteatum]
MLVTDQHKMADSNDSIHINTTDYLVACAIFSFLCYVVFSFSIKLLTFLFKRKTTHTVRFNGVNIVTTVTNSPSVINSVLWEFRSESLIGLDIEWDSASPTSKVATLQLCHGSRCIIIQLLSLNSIPRSLRRLLSDQSITFVGVGITEDIAKLDRDYGLKCWSGTELGSLADEVSGTKQFLRAGLKSLMHQIVGLRMEKPAHVTRSNWGLKTLNTEQIKYGTIDAYASYAIGNKLLYVYD